ncbi:MAG: hypothetical protein PHR16_11535 [Methylovulum sp.]|nr:hypothetical protein [Methylovulum sp.]
MSNEENSKQALDSKKESAINLMASILQLKDKNPKVFFGAISGLVLVVLIMIMSGGDSTPVSKAAIKNIEVGQRYVLKSANAYDPAATVRLVSTPGAIAAYDDTEEADRSGACQHMPQGTQVTAMDFSDAYGKKNAYVKVKIEEGECKGNEGWALAIDVQ